MIFFFFQAEDGIRDVAVTGVQTCALPILFHGETGISRATAFCRIRIRHARVGVRDSPQHEGSRSLEATASGYSPLPLQTNRNGSAGATALCHRLPRDRVSCLIGVNKWGQSPLI